MKIKVCHKCKKEFITNSGSQKFCSIKCVKVFEKEYCRIYRQKHREERKNYEKTYYDKNRKKLLKSKRLYNQTAEGIYISLKSGAKDRNINFNLIKEKFIKWYNNQIKKCVYCGRKENVANRDRNKYYRRLSIDRKNNNRGYELNNLVLCCHRCNLRKSDDLTFEQMLKVSKFINQIQKG
jgi:5-methylcytosine-specific restriction endonuclease McrA